MSHAAARLHLRSPAQHARTRTRTRGLALEDRVLSGYVLSSTARGENRSLGAWGGRPGWFSRPRCSQGGIFPTMQSLGRPGGPSDPQGPGRELEALLGRRDRDLDGRAGATGWCRVPRFWGPKSLRPHQPHPELRTPRLCPLRSACPSTGLGLKLQPISAVTFTGHP